MSLDWQFPAGGTLDFISAGQQDRDYSSQRNTVDWDDFYDRLGGGLFFDALQADMRANDDYILIDSRTGLSDIADICTVHFPDILVDCFTLSDQSINGAAQVADYISKKCRSRNIRILPVPMRIDEGEMEKVETGRMLAQSRFEGLPKTADGEPVTDYWGAVEIPYRPFYAYEETLATFGEAPGSPTSLLGAFERLTAVITDGAVSKLPAMDEEIRKQYRDAFKRRRPAFTPELLISYVAEDRMWADWIGWLLGRVPFRVTMQDAAALHGSRGGTSAPIASSRVRTLALTSASYARSPLARSAWDAAAAADPTGIHKSLIPVRVGAGESPEIAAMISGRTVVDLRPLDEKAAVDALLRSLGKPAYLTNQLLEGYDGAEGRTSGARYPGSRPRVRHVPSRNATFTGRNAVLQQLRDQLSGAGAGTLPAQALYGLGGVGKAQLAIEYAYRFMADYDVVWWISAEESELVVNGLADLAKELNLRVGEMVADAARAAREALRRGEPTRRWRLAPPLPRRGAPAGDLRLLRAGTDLDDAAQRRRDDQSPGALRRATARQAAPETLRLANSLAISLRKLGSRVEAREFSRTTHERYLARYGVNYPEALDCTLTVAADLFSTGEPEAAHQLAAKVRDAYQRTLGPNHPFTMLVENNIATYLRGMKRFEEAHVQFSSSFERLREKLGDRHPYTLACAVNLANCEADLGRLAQAEALGRWTHTILTEVLGADHPDTHACEANLAVTLHQLGRSMEARAVQNRLQDAMTRQLGAEHAHVLALAEWIRINRDLEPQPF